MVGLEGLLVGRVAVVAHIFGEVGVHIVAVDDILDLDG